MAKTSRLESLDIFRGMTVAFMIIVNTPGSWNYVYDPLKHSEWNGCTPADLVFPFFLLIVGISTWFSLKKYGFELNGASTIRILRRVAGIFALGLFLNIFPYFDRNYSDLRIMGVLQRIALAYGIGAVICMTIRRDYLWILVAFILLGYWGLLSIFGGEHPFSPEGNFALKVDSAILGTRHLYRGFGIPFDPEGLLSTLTATCTVIIGFYAGGIVGKGISSYKTAVKLFVVGVALTGLGILWGKFLPINKPLWTSSYVLYTAGIGSAVFSFIYWLTDVIGFRKWGLFFSVFGINALFSFFLSGIWTRILQLIRIPAGESKINLYTWIYERIFVPVAGNMNGSLVFAIVQMMIIWGMALILYRKKVLIRL
ncbi:MAG: hypothetical protein Q8868_03850 [Bacteroidota bacterium]|nr:hypothetical protein [Bacteroidota bacterium]